MTIGEAASKARKKAGLTINELAEKSGYSAGTIWGFENNIRGTHITIVIDLADTLGISVSEYIGQKGKTGKWVKKYPQYENVGLYYCSVCRKIIDIGAGVETPLNKGKFYCDNCGADMREGAENG